uniref:tRNA 4-demethylwyosine synthase (AdoMet-dependent) n=1 Tax=Noccaea caerulescens TaxID=107243 RepID=A0A1J3C7N0_NOCCA
MAASSSLRARLAFVVLLSATTFYCIHKYRRLKRLKNLSLNPSTPTSKASRGKIFFISQTGTAKDLAQRLHELCAANDIAFDLVDPRSYEPEDLPKESLVIFIASTWDGGKPPQNGEFLVNWLSESAEDFRVGSLLLSECKFAVFGVGSRAYGESYNAVAKELSSRMVGLGGLEMIPVGEGDVDDGEVDSAFQEWCAGVIRALKGGSEQESNVVLQNGAVENDDEYIDTTDDEDDNNAEADIVDLEDIAGKAPSRKNGVVKVAKGDGKKEMVTPVIRASLTKQGYKIIGSHSGVKICRWTKSQLRGRGGCYKHSFYGIESHRCMETTPSLACANKCVFCWRHHTNPVGKSWQWKMDDPKEIVKGALDLHTKMIKQMKGVPGVTPEKLQEGLNPRHCALSLVGEPIMYPEINALVDELHGKRISTFLVTNAQFPEKILMMKPITQLYVSVDAATKESLKAIDRPLFADFWERFIDSLKALQEKQQRTVYRLTLVKGWNTEELDAYFNLFSIGKPDFIEIKGVTYCGSSATSKLTMENVPWHADVKAFSEALSLKSEGEYEVACEHAHSCCVLLGRTQKFKKNGKWFTWIDYEKFHDLVASGELFTSTDYMAETPSWAVYGAEEGGFDPDQLRYKKERHHHPKPQPQAVLA